MASLPLAASRMAAFFSSTLRLSHAARRAPRLPAKRHRMEAWPKLLYSARVAARAAPPGRAGAGLRGAGGRPRPGRPSLPAAAGVSSPGPGSAAGQLRLLQEARARQAAPGERHGGPQALQQAALARVGQLQIDRRDHVQLRALQLVDGRLDLSRLDAGVDLRDLLHAVLPLQHGLNLGLAL